MNAHLRACVDAVVVAIDLLRRVPWGYRLGVRARLTARLALGAGT